MPCGIEGARLTYVPDVVRYLAGDRSVAASGARHGLPFDDIDELS